MTNYLNILIISGVLMTSCSKNATEMDNSVIPSQKEKASQGHTMNAVLWQQTAAEYNALCYQIYNMAKLQLDQRLHAHAFPYEKKPAIVMDLDETVVDNSRYNAQLLLDSENYTKETWKDWSDLAKAAAVPGAIEFIAYAQGKGVEVIFISNRRASEMESTMKNVLALGVTNVDSSNFLLRTDESSKMNRRAKISEDHDILMLFGDNLADFTEVFDKRTNVDRNDLVDQMHEEFGASFIVLPNVMYGEWEGSLYEYRYDWTFTQRDSLRNSFVLGYK